MGKPTLEKFFFVKGIQKTSNRLRRRNPKSKLLQPLISPQQFIIIHTVSPRSKDRDKRLYIVGLQIFALSLKKRKMPLNRLRQSQGSEGFHHQWKTTKRSDEDFRCILN
jgi:hypothetical protein